jgi:hypothetical protein
VSFNASSATVVVRLKLRLKKLNLSPVAALQELDSLYKVYLRDSRKGFQLSRVVALSRMQEKIMKTTDKKLLPQM